MYHEWQGIVSSFINNSSLPAAYMAAINVASNEEFRYAHNYDNDGNNILRIASMTKLLTSLAGIQLLDEGKISLDESLNEHLPEMVKVPILTDNGETHESNKPITLRHLLTHTAGFAYPFFSEKIRRFKKVEENLSNWQYEASMSSDPRLFEPGTDFSYGLNIDWVGRLVEKLSGLNLEDYFRQFITGPLGMDSTWFNLPEELNHKVVDFAQKSGDSYKIFPERIPGKLSYYEGGGGLKSSPNDYLRLLKCLLNKGELDGVRILSAEMVKKMFENQLPDDVSLKYEEYESEMISIGGDFFDQEDQWGLAFALENNPEEEIRPKGTGYWGGIFNSYFTIDLNNQIGIVYFSQFLPFNNIEAHGLYRLFESLVYDKK